jgi:hypothetical protein
MCWNSTGVPDSHRDALIYRELSKSMLLWEVILQSSSSAILFMLLQHYLFSKFIGAVKAEHNFSIKQRRIYSV